MSLPPPSGSHDPGAPLDGQTARLLGGISERELTDEECQQLQQRLKSDPQLVQAYLDQIITHAMLEWRFSTNSDYQSESPQLIGHIKVRGEIAIHANSTAGSPLRIVSPARNQVKPKTKIVRNAPQLLVAASLLLVAAPIIFWNWASFFATAEHAETNATGDNRDRQRDATPSSAAAVASITSWRLGNVRYSFDSSLQGWLNAATSEAPNAPHHFAVYDPQGTGMPDPQRGVGMLAPDPFGSAGGTYRNSPHRTLVCRSPEFGLTVDSTISFWLIGGSKPLPAFQHRAEENLPKQSSPQGSLFVALRRVRDGAYLLAASRRISGQAREQWKLFAWKPQDLAALASDKDRYTLDVVDFSDGDWSWIGLDEVSLDHVLLPATPPVQASGQTASPAIAPATTHAH